MKKILGRKGNKFALDLVFGDHSIENWLQIELAKEFHAQKIGSISIGTKNHNIEISTEDKGRVGIELKTQVDKGRFSNDIKKLKKSLIADDIQEAYFLFLWMRKEIKGKSFHDTVLKREFVKYFSEEERKQLKDYKSVERLDKTLGIFCVQIH